ncbi:unnamed protein product [Moneuplotes crassus]|uniref:Uncharacterized protein n=1 Tax=Euplotes crassus TaxID=5936 RepID=A0AAD1U9L3_EUPCR|nr:unnamed protein product [Moneuplotes crassus]
MNRKIQSKNESLQLLTPKKITKGVIENKLVDKFLKYKMKKLAPKKLKNKQDRIDKNKQSNLNKDISMKSQGFIRKKPRTGRTSRISNTPKNSDLVEFRKPRTVKNRNNISSSNSKIRKKKKRGSFGILHPVSKVKIRPKSSYFPMKSRLDRPSTSKPSVKYQNYKKDMSVKLLNLLRAGWIYR